MPSQNPSTVLWVPEDFKEEIKEICRQNDVTRVVLVREILEEWMNNPYRKHQTISKIIADRKKAGAVSRGREE